MYPLHFNQQHQYFLRSYFICVPFIVSTPIPAPGDIFVLEIVHLSISDKAFEMVAVHSFCFIDSQQFQNLSKVKGIHEAKARIFWNGVI